MTDEQIINDELRGYGDRLTILRLITATAVSVMMVSISISTVAVSARFVHDVYLDFKRQGKSLERPDPK